MDDEKPGASSPGSDSADMLREVPVAKLDLLLNADPNTVKAWNIWRKEEPGGRLNLRYSELDGRDLSGVDLSRADLYGANLQGTVLEGAKLEKAILRRCNLERAKLDGARLNRAELDGSRLVGAKLRKADMAGAVLGGADARSADFSNARLHLLEGEVARLEFANLYKAVFKGADLRKADFSGAVMTECRLEESNLEGANLVGTRLARADLGNANLSAAKLYEANLCEAKLHGAALTRADLRRSNLQKAALDGASLAQAWLNEAQMAGASIVDTDFRDADLTGAYLPDGLRRANMNRARGSLSELGLAEVRIQNRTGRRIKVSGETMILPPFGERELDQNAYHRLRDDIERWHRAGMLTVSAVSPSSSGAEASRFRRLMSLRLGPEPEAEPHENVRSGTGADAEDGDTDSGLPPAPPPMPPPLEPGAGAAPPERDTAQRLSLTAVVLIAVGLPVAAALTLGRLPASNADWLGQLLQWSLAAVLSALPAILYFLFDRQQVDTLRENFYRDVLHLDPKILTLEDAKAIYGIRVAEVYGNEGDGGRLLSGTRSPVILATFLLAIGWSVVFLAAGPPADLAGHFMPAADPIVFAFLGAYFFAINMIVRRYTRADLKPKAYSHVIVRVVVALLLTWVMMQVPALSEEPLILVLAFLVGVVPETGVTIIRETAERALRRAIPSLDEPLPLDRLDGITIYEQARLLEEGIENVEHLVHQDLVDLMLQTRIPLTRLIDWIDQGLLHLHLCGRSEAGKAAQRADLDTLRSYGIRTASDLIEVYATAAAQDREAARNGQAPEAVRSLFVLLEPEHERRDSTTGEGGKPQRLATVYDALQNDEWLSHILSWRERSRLPGEHCYELGQMYLSSDELKAELAQEAKKKREAREKREGEEEREPPPVTEPGRPPRMGAATGTGAGAPAASQAAAGA